MRNWEPRSCVAMKNHFYEKARRRFNQSSNVCRQPIQVPIENYYKLNWLGLKVGKTDAELWDEFGLVPEKFLDFEGWT